MATLDWIVLGLFCLALIGVVFWVLKKKDKDTSDYFLAGRDATWIAIGASIFASNIGSEHLVGLAGAGAESGMAMAQWEMQGWLILMHGYLYLFMPEVECLPCLNFLKRDTTHNPGPSFQSSRLLAIFLQKLQLQYMQEGWFSRMYLT